MDYELHHSPSINLNEFDHINRNDDNNHGIPQIKYDDDIISYGHYAIMRKTFDVNSCKLVRFDKENKYFYFYKRKILTNSLIGMRFGSTFELPSNDKSLKIVNIEDYIATKTDPIGESGMQKDNRSIRDDNSSQKLSRNDIEKIKRETSGEAVIKSLIENSKTFGEKNVFAQAKYLQKKQQKYMNLYTVLKPTIKFLMEMYYSQGPAKNNYLRLDSLAQILTFSNIMSDGRYMVIDSNLGILSSAIMEKTSGKCQIIQIETKEVGNASQRQAVYALNYPKSVLEQCLSCISIYQVAKLLNETEHNDTFKSLTYHNLLKQRKSEKLQLEEQKATNLLREKNLDALLIMSKEYDPYCLAQILLKFLSPSRPLVIFSPTIEPLKNCFVKLKSDCVFLRLSETWLRKYQVLNDRTRPEMIMNASSGFILTGIKVIN
ncbi:glutaryl-CoA dehydrogenase-like [Sarcoptes scabiei]|nr:glutaryl-CoA dehydrogenase-like [Sarcoptes scabiei]